MAPVKGKLNDKQLRHLLRRAMFGASENDLHHFSGKKIKKIMQELLADTDMPAPPVNNYNDPPEKKDDVNYYVDEEIPEGQTWITATITNGKNNGRRKNSFKAWWVSQMLNQSPNIREKMVLFWHNHFATETAVIDNAIYIYRHNELLRKHALGNFKEMVKAITLDPAMLKYLNGNANTKKAPDENYGRELQELFTVGKGPDSHYTENDVKAAARVLTGYRIDNKTFTSVFEPGRHDDTDKQFSAFYNNTVIKGRKKEEGKEELDELIDMIFAQPEVAKFICRKLYRFFVYHQIDDKAEANVITPLADVFRKNKYEIKPVLEALFSSDHFFEAANYGGMIKSPVDLVVGFCREFEVKFDNANAVPDQYGLWLQLQQQASSMQQNIGDPPNVAGWQAYYQEPQYDKLWISSDTLPKRNQFTDRMINNGLARSKAKLVVDVLAFTKDIPKAEDPNALIAELSKLFYSVSLSPEEQQFIKVNTLLSGLTNMQSDHYWTDAWKAFLENPDDKKNKDVVVKKLKALYRYMMNRPEYQLC
ncbi:MAG: hypothetical protein ABS85_12410 [Sphingobacteriales bacterium SCN 48-20]|nr:MAG: hypothetical protein ABS85_12410 [Sphingobacteriales bacterium SCN 48-20]OJW45881.1 MAG: hypothetical protein BGO56_01475 [Sphingobacteriales bacterium 48-107]